jgi:hypothetical protein
MDASRESNSTYGIQDETLFGYKPFTVCSDICRGGRHGGCGGSRQRANDIVVDDCVERRVQRYHRGRGVLDGAHQCRPWSRMDGAVDNSKCIPRPMLIL